MEFHVAVLKLGDGKVHLLQSLQVQDIDASSDIHEALGKVIPINAGTNNQGVVLLWNYRWMVLPAEGNRLF